jgi:guanylate kinase
VTRRGKLIVISGPSGVGKETVVREAAARDPESLSISVSATTRPPRSGEVDGVDYRFVSREEFDRLAAGGELLEWATYAGERYGTPLAPVEAQRSAGRDVILVIEVRGAAQVKERVPDAVLIFLLPPSLQVLEDRLRGRGTEDEERIRSRLETAQRELRQAGRFDERVVNDDVVRAAAEVAAIIERSRSDAPSDTT